MIACGIDIIEIQRLKDINPCLLYTSDAADDLLCVDLGGRRIIKKKKTYMICVSVRHTCKLKNISYWSIYSTPT